MGCFFPLSLSLQKALCSLTTASPQSQLEATATSQPRCEPVLTFVTFCFEQQLSTKLHLCNLASRLGPLSNLRSHTETHTAPAEGLATGGSRFSTARMLCWRSTRELLSPSPLGSCCSRVRVRMSPSGCSMGKHSRAAPPAAPAGPGA